METLAVERRLRTRHGSHTTDLFLCPRCRSPLLESFTDGEGTDFRCCDCHQRWTISLGALIPVPD